jgi:hypothetical protein
MLMKIPIILEISPNLKIATLYRQCSRCSNTIGPFFHHELHELAKTSYCKFCENHFTSLKKNTCLNSCNFPS